MNITMNDAAEVIIDARDENMRLREEIAGLKLENKRLMAALKKLADPGNYTINSRNEIRWTRTDSSQYTPWGYARSVMEKEKN